MKRIMKGYGSADRWSGTDRKTRKGAKMNNADKFKQIFGLYATELWAMSEKDFLAWLNAERDVLDTNIGELISRQAALDALGERPIVWEDCDEYYLGRRSQYDSDKLAIETLPTVDAVPVVRCKDCKHRDAENGVCVGRGWPMQLVPDDGFCDKGERSEDEHTD